MAREGLQRHERIRSSAEFGRVLKKGTSYGGKTLVLFCLKAGEGEPRVGFTTTRRVPNAVVRNRAKRLMREAYRRLKVEIQGGGLRLVFLARGDTRSMSYDGVREEMRELLKSARLWKPRDGDT